MVDFSVPADVAPPAAPTTNPLASLGQFAQIQNALNQNRLFQQTFMARQAMGDIAKNSIDPTSGNLDYDKFITGIASNPLTAAFAGEQANQLRSAALSGVQMGGALQSQGTDLLKGLYSDLANGSTSPGDLQGLINARMATASPQLRAQMQPGINSLIHGLTDGLPSDPTQAAAMYRQRVAPLAAGLPADNQAAIYGTPVVINQGNQQQGAVKLPAWAGGGLVPGGAPLPTGLAPTFQNLPLGPSGRPWPVVVGQGGISALGSMGPTGLASAPALARAFSMQESGGNANAPTSATGNVGQFQIKPATAQMYGLQGDVNNPADNARMGQQLSSILAAKYPGDWQRAAVEYVSGPGNVAPPGSPTPWKRDVANSTTGQNVSQYVANIGARLGVGPGGANGANPFGALPMPLTGPTQQEAAYNQASAGKVAEMQSDLNTRVENIPNTLKRIDMMTGALSDFQAGGLADTRTGIAKLLQGLSNAGIINVPDETINRVANSSLPAAQIFKAEVKPLVIGELKEAAQGTGRVMRSEVDSFLQMMNETTDPRALIPLLNQAKYSLQVGYDQAQKFPQFKQGVQSGQIKGYDLSDFVPWYSKNFGQGSLPTSNLGRGLNLAPTPTNVAKGTNTSGATHRWNPVTRKIEPITP